jgi:adenine-specific DNA-methyltransferase
MPKKSNPATQVGSIHHQDKRANIPTQELRGFVAEDESAPKVMLYPRDASLDPQLVWKGKDQQDAEDLAVPVVPVYIQEKIKPQAIVADLLRKDGHEPQMSMFADFDGIEDLGEMVDFYHHEQNWSNRMILGDSLLVMTSLSEKEGLKGKVQCIYLDPPYGIKFGSNWQVSTRKRDVKDGKAEDATRQPEQVRAFRDTWQLGIHSYLAYLRDRLVVAKELLTETGSIFVQIGSENVHLVRCLMDEVFGADNFIALTSFRTTANIIGNYLGSNTNYLLWYANAYSLLKYRQLYMERTIDDDIGDRYTRVELNDRSRRFMNADERNNPLLLPSGSRIFRHDNLVSQGPTSTGTVRYTFEGQEFHPGQSSHWKTSVDGLRRLSTARRLAAPTPNSLAYVRYLADFPVAELTNVWLDTQTGAFTDDKVYIVQTNTKVIERCMLMSTDPGDLVLDPTCGSGTTAYVAEQWGRRWITIDTSRVALALARTRLMAAKYSYYLLADSQEGVQKEAAITGMTPPGYQTDGNIRKGFVYKRVPHITLKSIANNTEIDTIHDRWQGELDQQRAQLNTATGRHWKEWEIPRAADPNWPETAKTAHAAWWQARQERQKQIDASIARNADTEILYDQPYEDSRRVRVAGPFTVESLSPHRVLPADEDMDGQVSAEEAKQTHDFTTMILDNLRTAGVQNSRKNERMKLSRLEPMTGEWLQARGEYEEADGTVKRVAVSIGPQYGTVGPAQVTGAAKEAVKGQGFDILIVCGFAFDPHVSEEAKNWGRLTILPARMNPDLNIGGDLLKKTGAANLFMVFGEPDVEVKRQADGRLTVEVFGVDIYDPTTGEIRSSSTDDIACWFIDTDYNEESFFVRHAYFTGKDQPYDKLQRALRAEVDEEAWQSLYRTVSRPFPPPASGRIAVKVINHYGDEVLKVYDAR